MAVLLGGVLVVRVALQKLSDLIKWERLHWTIQGIGLLLGGIRGLWWSGLVVVIMLSLGVPSLAQSIQGRSILGPQLVTVARTTIDQVADRYPGHRRRVVLIPTITLRLPSLPKPREPF